MNKANYQMSTDNWYLCLFGIVPLCTVQSQCHTNSLCGIYDLFWFVLCLGLKINWKCYWTIGCVQIESSLNEARSLWNASSSTIITFQPSIEISIIYTIYTAFGHKTQRDRKSERYRDTFPRANTINDLNTQWCITSDTPTIPKPQFRSFINVK